MKKILIFTGAGLSAESGINTFRDTNGLWDSYDPMEVANIQKMESNRELIFDFYNKMRNQLEHVEPNAAHFGISEMQLQYGFENVQIFTQNVDDLLEKAGCQDVTHVHGTLTDMLCRSCGNKWDVEYQSVSSTTTCPCCASNKTKPAVVFFGENAPEYQKLYSTFGHSRNDLIIVIGTSGEVVPLKYIAGNRRSDRRSTTLLNNLEHDKFGSIDYSLFDTVLFEPATSAINRIREIANTFMAD